MVFQFRQQFPCKAHYINKRIGKINTVRILQYVINKIDIEIYVIAYKDIRTDKIIEKFNCIGNGGSISNQIVCYPGQFGYKAVNRFGGFNKSSKRIN